MRRYALEFDDFEDLIGALLSSCHIPLYCGWPARMYRAWALGFRVSEFRV
jgi:hypothetical protein